MLLKLPQLQMIKITLKYGFCFLVFFHLLLIATSKVGAQNPPPNIIFIIADDLGYNDLGTYGSKYFQTPNLDNLASTGWKFTQAYANAPNCAPSRASLLTGMFPPKHEIYTVASSERGEAKNRKLVPVVNKTVLDTSFYTMAEMLSDAGYECMSIGKWHLGEGAFSPLGHGFSRNIGGTNAGNVSSHYKRFKTEIPGFENVHDTVYLADGLTGAATDYLKEKKTKPFFLYLPYYAVHTPIEAPAYLVEKYRKIIPPDAPYSPVYAAMVENLDINVGKIVTTLHQQGISDNTLIVFFSDNGPMINLTTVNLRGEKGTLYDGGIREPLIINWPRQLKPGKVVHKPVSAVDFFPTFVEIAGAKIPAQAALDGKSLLPLFKGKRVHNAPIVWHFPAYLESYGKDTRVFRETPSSAVRNGKWKLVVHYENMNYELFNIQKDPMEKRDLYALKKRRAASMKKMLDNYLTANSAFIPREINPDYKPRF